jgi:hypothetical protein
MANLNAPFGLSAVRYLDGRPYNGAVNLYAIAPTNTNGFYIGDVVATDGTNGGDGFGIPAVTVGAAGAAVRGVIAAIGTNPRGGPFVNPSNLYGTFSSPQGGSSLGAISRPAGAQAIWYYAAVIDDPNVLFAVMENSSATPTTGGTPLAATNIGLNANLAIAAPAAGNVLSGTYLNNNTAPATTATFNVKIMRSPSDGQNVPFTAWQRWLVMINNHELRAGTTGV